MKYGRATTDLHAKSNTHHQTNIAIQTNKLYKFVQVIVALRQSKNTISGPEFHR